MLNKDRLGCLGMFLAGSFVLSLFMLPTSGAGVMETWFITMIALAIVGGIGYMVIWGTGQGHREKLDELVRRFDCESRDDVISVPMEYSHGPWLWSYDEPKPKAVVVVGRDRLVLLESLDGSIPLCEIPFDAIERVEQQWDEVNTRTRVYLRSGGRIGVSVPADVPGKHRDNHRVEIWYDNPPHGQAGLFLYSPLFLTRNWCEEQLVKALERYAEQKNHTAQGAGEGG